MFQSSPSLVKSKEKGSSENQVGNTCEKPTSSTKEFFSLWTPGKIKNFSSGFAEIIGLIRLIKALLFCFFY